MSKNLIIVESPAKAKTINKFLGKDYVVTSCYGHIRDLPDSGLNIDIENGFEPNYVINEDKEKVIKELKKCLRKCGLWSFVDKHPCLFIYNLILNATKIIECNDWN